MAIQGYDTGIQAPGRCSIAAHLFCKEGKSDTEPYQVAHNVLLAHAAVYRSYQKHFKVLFGPEATYMSKFQNMTGNLQMLAFLENSRRVRGHGFRCKVVRALF